MLYNCVLSDQCFNGSCVAIEQNGHSIYISDAYTSVCFLVREVTLPADKIYSNKKNIKYHNEFASYAILLPLNYFRLLC